MTSHDNVEHNAEKQSLESEWVQRVQELDDSRQECQTCSVLYRQSQRWLHEFRPPLSPIIGFSAMLLESDTLNAEQRQHAEAIYQNSQVLLRAVNAFAEGINPEHRHTSLLEQ
jgi:signal transduction histidine kinase